MKGHERAVVVVDDGENDRELFRIATVDAKWLNGVVEFESGEEFIQYLERSKGEGFPALIVLDLKMPGTDGFQVLRWLRIRRDWDRVPTVILTSSSHDADRVQAMSLGASEYYVKPSTYVGLVKLAVELRQRWLKPEWPQGINPSEEQERSVRSRRTK